MFYIHQTACISPQPTFVNKNFLSTDPVDFKTFSDNRFLALEPAYNELPPGILRRMGKAVRLGVGAAIELLRNQVQDGIILGTSMGGMEDCIKFLNQIIEYNEGQLTPTNFVQSTPNAIAGQAGLLSRNKGYNITHVHRGFSFENAVIDADMMISESAGSSFLLGSVDEVSAFNYNIEKLGGWYKDEALVWPSFYDSDTAGSFAGEGAAMFIVNGDATNAAAQMMAIQTIQTSKVLIVADQLKHFLETNLPAGEKPDLLLSGENGDNRFQEFYDTCETTVGKETGIARFKHLCGEYATASGFAMWLACEIIKKNFLPGFLLKTAGAEQNFRNVVIYNNYKGVQHSFILLKKV